MCVELCSFYVTYQELHQNGRASPFQHPKNEYDEAATDNLA
jgi:hypothetical protein